MAEIAPGQAEVEAAQSERRAATEERAVPGQPAARPAVAGVACVGCGAVGRVELPDDAEVYGWRVCSRCAAGCRSRVWRLEAARWARIPGVGLPAAGGT